MKKDHKFPFEWSIKGGYPSQGVKPNYCKVFGTFICGGGSSMGYKLAGYHHLGGVEIDEQVAGIYKRNHDPKYLFVEDIRAFNKRTDLPKELYELDILDGSPPCSSFSLTGNRETDWGKKKKFREGQSHQRLDNLVFEYVKTINKLQPKVAILENVKGMILGNAKAYSRKVIEEFTAAGYNVQLFLLNAASMGVPQKRERVFFIGLRKDFKLNKLVLKFREKPIWFSAIDKAAKNIKGDEYKEFTDLYLDYWHQAKQGEPVGKFKSTARKLKYNGIAPTLTAGSNYGFCHSLHPRPCSKYELCMIGTFPIDYQFGKTHWHYLIGMSVPPIMIAQIANQIWEQWLSKIKT